MQLPPSQVRQMVEEAVDSATALLDRHAAADTEILVAAYESWDKRNQILLDRAFRTTGFLASGPKNDYLFALGLEYPFGIAMAEPPIDVEKLSKDISTKVNRLRTILESLDAYGEPTQEDRVGETVSPPARVFVVHGRDETARLQVELLITKATSVEAVVLADQANGGASTLIEKLEEHLSADRSGMAVVLMTGDDEGRLVGTSDLHRRARQNVVLELGYAMAALGRRRVVILHQTGVEIPSDISGVAYYELDAGGAWRGRLLGELTAAGIEVDARALM